jgi:glucosamine--fructose-6-phosphate aminotransferase (isomerizing)
LYLGRGYNSGCFRRRFKVKRDLYIHAEDPAAEMKHGPIALIDESMPVVVIAKQGHYDENCK